MRKLAYLIVLIVILGLIISGCIFHTVPPLGQDGSTDIVKNDVFYKIDLIAGQHTVAGSITVSNDDENLLVTYETVDNWLINATHLYVGTTIPTNSAPGKFPYKHEEPGGVTTGTYEIPLEDLGVGPCDIVYIAAHAELVKGETEETGWAKGVKIEPGKNWAMYFNYQISPCGSEIPELTEAISQNIDLSIGGTIEVDDPESIINGVKLIIPPIPSEKKGGKLIANITISYIDDPYSLELPDNRGFLLPPLVINSDILFDAECILEIPYTEDNLSNVGLSSNKNIKVYYYNYYTSSWEEVSINKGNYKAEIDFDYMLELTLVIEEPNMTYACSTPSIFLPPHGFPQPGDLLYKLSFYGISEGWIPGHVGIYVGEHEKDSEGNPYNVIEALLFGGVQRNYYNPISDFSGSAAYMGAGQPKEFDPLTSVQRDIIVEYAKGMVGLPYAIETFSFYFGLARGDWVKGTDALGSYNCVGLAEKAYEIAGVNGGQGLVSDLDEGNFCILPSPTCVLTPVEQYAKTEPAEGYSVSGKVTDSQGVEIPDVTLNLELVSFNDYHPDSIKVTTDSNGEWSGDKLGREWKVTPQKDGYTFEPSTMKVKEDANDIDFVGKSSKYFRLDVPYVEQNSDNTCLPASAAMILKYYNDPRDIAEIQDKLALPWQADGTGGIMTIGSDGKWHGDIDILFDHVESLGFTAKKEYGLTIEEIKNKLEGKFPIIVLQDFYEDARFTGHFSVIVGYREIGESDEENKLIINDPWWLNRGQYWEVTYSDFKIRNSDWWKEIHDLNSDLAHSYIIWKDTSITNYTITTSAGPNGSISPSGNINVNEGSDQSFIITPDAGYQIDNVLVDGNFVGTENSYTFANVIKNHTISATFNVTPTNTVSNVVAVYWTDHYPSNSQNIEHLINVFWDPYIEAGGYKVYRSVNGVVEAEPVYSGPGEFIFDKKVVQWHDTDILVSNNYSYYVTAYGDGWETAPSQETGTINTFLPPIYLVSPSDGGTINSSTPTFEWSPVGANPGGSMNSGITELWVKDLTDDKVTWDISFNDMTTSNAIYDQDGQASPLILGHSYAWEVTSYGSIDNMEVAISQSEYWEFIFGTSTAPVHNLNKDTYYDTIQAALDDANTNNTIEVADGTYDESITFPPNKKVILRSLNGPFSTIIRGDDGLATVSFSDPYGSQEKTTLEGFTITHADGLTGRGIFSHKYNPIINNCIISGNHYIWNWLQAIDGGGIANVTDSNLTIIGSIISENSSTGSVGGIANLSKLTIIGSIISNNSGNWVGGIASEWGNLNITGSIISNNSAYEECGGIYLKYLETCNIGGNSDSDKNTICGNYKSGYDPSLDQQIRDESGSLYETYKDTNYISAYCGALSGSVHNLTKDTYYDTIQAALDNAASDNIIEVADGTYDESITFPFDKVIILQSVNGSSSTTIRGDNDSPTITFGDSLAGTTLKGLTVTHADGITGRGIYITGGDLAIKNCTISGNTSDVHGGGIWNDASSLTITGSTISDNAAGAEDFVNGGGIYNLGTLTITGSTISDNSGGHGGGGIMNYGSITITGSTISGNAAGGWAGGGICNMWGKITIFGSTISGNAAKWRSGGIHNDDGSITITGSTISGNAAGAEGGGICTYKGSITITGSTISGNAAGGWCGGGICLYEHDQIIIGGSNTADKNIICGNYKNGDSPSLDQQIVGISASFCLGSLYETYKDTNYISAYCESN